jgi:hypothetical protein
MDDEVLQPLTVIVVGAVVVLVLLPGVAAAWLGLRLRRRAMRRGQYPFRNLPWYLGGVPEVKVPEPPSTLSKRRVERGRTRPHAPDR